MKQEMEHGSGEDTGVDPEKKKILKELEEKLSRTEMKAEQIGLEYSQAQTKVNSIKSSIDNIFNIIECDVRAHHELLGT